MHKPSVKTVIYVPSMTIFPKKKTFYKTKFIGKTPIFTCFYQVPCVFVGSEFLVSYRRLRKPRHFYGLSPLGTMSDHNWQVFTRVGIYPFLLYLTHVFFISFFFSATVRLILNIVPFYRAHHRRPNTVSIYHVLATYHRTPNTVSISTM